VDRTKKRGTTTDHRRYDGKISSKNRFVIQRQMLGHHPKHKTMMTSKKKVTTVKNRFVQDRIRVIVKVIAVPTTRPLLNQRQSMPKTTRRENKQKRKKRKQLKIKSDKQKKKLRDLLGLPKRMLFKPQLQKLQPIPPQLVHLIQHRPPKTQDNDDEEEESDES
jgi:hypothetical protein